MKSPKYHIYGRKSCPYCILAKELLYRRGFEYVYFDIEENDVIKQRFRDEGWTTVPQIEEIWPLNMRTHIGGYDELKELLDA